VKFDLRSGPLTGQAGKEFTWFALGASLPLISMDAERAARQLISAVRQRKGRRSTA
jgi:hypothetical protein